MANNKVPIILGAVGGVVGVAGMVVGLVMGLNNKSNPGFKLTLDAGEHGTIDGERIKEINQQTIIQTAYNVQANVDYEFKGWYQDEATTKDVKYPFTLTQDTTFYAKYDYYSPTTYTVDYVVGDGATPIESTIVLKGKSISRPSTSLEDHELIKWHEGSKTGPEVFKKTGSTYETYTPSASTTLYAEWKQIAFTLKFDSNGGVVPGTSQEEGNIYKLEHVSNLKTPPLANKAENTFLGWFTDEACTKDASFPYIPKTNNEMLYAKWTPTTVTHTITLDANGGTIVGPTTYTVTQLPYAPTATRDQHELDTSDNKSGWSKKNIDGSTTPVTFPYTPDDDVTLIANWKRVAFNAAMMHGKSQATAVAYEGASWQGIKLLRYADIPQATENDIDTTGKEGSAADYHNYELARWVDMDEGSTATYEPGNVNINPLTKDTNLFAEWTQTKFNVTLHNVDQTATHVLTGLKKDDLKEAPAIPDGWVGPHEASVGWYDGPGEGAHRIEFPYATQLTADLDFYLKKEPSMGKVYLHVSDQPGSATYNGTEDWYYTEAYASRGSGFNKRGQPEVAYKKALGWARVDSDIGEDGDAPTAADIVPDNKWPVRPEPNRIAHLYPMYQDTHYKLTFITNGGSEVSDRMVEANKVVPESDIPTTIKGGSQFLYWCKDQACSQQMDWTEEITGNKTLYAKFEEVAWKVTYHYYNNVEKTFVSDDWYKVIPDYYAAGGTEEPKHPQGLDYPFVGWSKTPNQNHPDPDLIGSTITADTDLYAAFPDDSSTCTVTVMPNGAEWSDGSTDPKTFKAYQGYNPLTKQEDVFTFVNDTLTKEGASLNGWAKNEEGTLINYNYDLYENGTEIAGGTGRKITLYPNWKDHAIYQVTFDASPGYFKYYNTRSSSIETTRSFVYTVNENVLGANPTFKTVYDAFLEEISDTKLKVTGPTNDGFQLNLIDGAGWLAQGQKIQNDTTMDMIGAATLTANYVEKSPSNWWTDDWYTVVNVANKGENALKTTYASAYNGTDADGEKGTATKKANTFVGLQKTMTMSDYGVEEFRTRVIGTKEDTISGSTDKALLTFDFIDCPISGEFGRTNNYLADNSFHNSTLRKLLFGALPDGLKNGLLPVTKYAIEPVSDYSKVSASSFTADLFLLSATEVNGNTSQSAKIEYEKGEGHFATYTYYSKAYSGVDPNDIGTSTTYNSYRFKYYNGQLTSWWTRTPAHPDCYFPEGGVSGWNSSAFYISTNEHSSSTSKPYQGGVWMWESTGARGISPGFCIGVVK